MPFYLTHHKSSDRMNYEVWKYTEPTGRMKLAEFRFLFEAEKYIKVFHKNSPDYFYIVEKGADK